MSAPIVFRFDADTTIGHGHLTRCLAIAEELRGAGHHCVAATRAAPPLPIRTFEIPADVAPGDEGTLISQQIGGRAVIIADLFQSTPAQLDGFRAVGPLVRIEDDESAPPERCALLVNPNFVDLPAALIACADEYLGGRDALILRAQFSVRAAYDIRDALHSAIVCFGGSDPVEATCRVVEALRTSPARLSRIVVVIGSSFQGSIALARLIDNDPRFSLQRGVVDMAAALHSVDVAVIAAGTLLYEALAVGVPSIAVSITPTQAREARYAAAMGAGHYLGTHADITADSLFAALDALEDPAQRRAVSNRARSLVDGNGCARVASRIAALVAAP